jgi:hypothetical protein
VSVSDVEVSRALNALVVTLNDRRDEEPDVERWQAIVTGSLGGEPRIEVRRDPTRPAGGALLDESSKELGRIWREGGRWLSERVGAPLSGAYIPR